MEDSIIQKLNTSIFVKNEAKRGKYTVIVQYVVAKDGHIADVKCLNDPGYGMYQEAIRVIHRSSWSSKWRQDTAPVIIRPMR
jgi:hypothetical protein